ncbi:hypothetical protein QNE52_002860 [Vibrio parahaemolyticus]|nr:hypothetical protein [Vibrio parahaemolyticus]
MNEPNKISAGTSVSWSFPHELADGSWLFSYALRGQSVIDIDATAENGTVTVYETATATQNWTKGLYEWRLYASKGDDRHLVKQGKLEIEPDFLNVAEGHDPRSHARKMLDAINSVLEGRILSDHERYSIDDRSLDRIPIKELHSLRKTYLVKVRQEETGTSFRVKRVRTRLPG